ncbi:MAG: hypothetical protein EOO28_11930 [Comamonadaceae bacterium]|nr:MAG: hypothetical protein EOO28_11930 [Comamonadaceae bacterium]
METNARLQALLREILARFCDGNQAELARRLEKDASYVNRLFYPPTKPGARGIGKEVMEASKKAFPLPFGYWEMDPEEAFGDQPAKATSAGNSTNDQSPREVIIRLGELLKPLSKTRRETVKPVLIELANSPEDASEMASIFENIVGEPFVPRTR